MYGAEFITDYAKQNFEKLESAGYLHNDYNRFQEITHYDSILTNIQFEQMGSEIIRFQKIREDKCYEALGVKSLKELNELYFGDGAVKELLGSHFDNAYKIIADSFKEGFEKGSLQDREFNNENQKIIEERIENAFETKINDITKKYGEDFSKLTNRGVISLETAQMIGKAKNKKDNGDFKNAKEVAQSSFGAWKGRMGEIIVALFASQLDKIKNVEVTGSNLDELGRFIKSDVTTHTESMDIGFSVKNYKIETENGISKLSYPLSLHSGGNFESFLKRLKSLKSEHFQTEINQFTKGLSSDNYYYNLINEAVNKTTFKTSRPADEFITIVKELAAAWLGTEFITDTKEGAGGQNVDFLVISRFGIIPMSLVLESLQKAGNEVKVSITSKANIDMDNMYQRKLKQPWSPDRAYNQGTMNVGYYEGQNVYHDIDIGKIKMSLILSQLKIK